MNMLFTALRALVYMTGFVLFFGWLAFQTRVFDQALGITLPSWANGVGIALLIAGALLGLACVGTFVVYGRGTPAPFDSPTEFVAVGPYRRVRNPMYIGGLAMLMGFALYVQSLSMILFSAVWLLAAHCFILFYEERTLERRFGSSYLSYKARVPRWLPHRTRYPTH